MKNEIEVKLDISDSAKEVIASIIQWAVSAGMGIDQAGELMKKLYSGSETSVS